MLLPRYIIPLYATKPKQLTHFCEEWLKLCSHILVLETTKYYTVHISPQHQLRGKMSRPTVRYHRPPRRSLQVPVSPLRSTSRSPSPSRRIAVDNSNGLTIDDLVSEEPGSRTCRGNQGAQRRPSPSPTRQPSTRRSSNFSSDDEVELVGCNVRVSYRVIQIILGFLWP